MTLFCYRSVLSGKDHTKEEWCKNPDMEEIDSNVAEFLFILSK